MAGCMSVHSIIPLGRPCPAPRTRVPQALAHIPKYAAQAQVQEQQAVHALHHSADTCHAKHAFSWEMRWMNTMNSKAGRLAGGWWGTCMLAMCAVTLWLLASCLPRPYKVVYTLHAQKCD